MELPGLTELNAFIAVAANSNFRAAARKLDVSASALSHAVASLESRLGVRLFNRTTRSVALTIAGEEFLARVHPALREISDAVGDLHAQRDKPKGLIRINASELAGEQLIAHVLPKVQPLLPDVEIEVCVDDRLVDIVAGGFDAGVRLTDMIPRDMIMVRIGSEQRHIVVASPDYLRAHGTPQSPADLKDHLAIRHRLPGGGVTRWEFERHGETVNVDVRGPLTFDNYRLGLRAAVLGGGLAYVNEWAAREYVADGRLKVLLEDWCPAYPGLGLYYPSRRNLPGAFRAFVALLRAHDRD